MKVPVCELSTRWQFYLRHGNLRLDNGCDYSLEIGCDPPVPTNRLGGEVYDPLRNSQKAIRKVA
jgi:hypothetical protein